VIERGRRIALTRPGAKSPMGWTHGQSARLARTARRAARRAALLAPQAPSLVRGRRAARVRATAKAGRVSITAARMHGLSPTTLHFFWRRRWLMPAACANCPAGNRCHSGQCTRTGARARSECPPKQKASCAVLLTVAIEKARCANAVAQHVRRERTVPPPWRKTASATVRCDTDVCR